MRVTTKLVACIASLTGAVGANAQSTTTVQPAVNNTVVNQTAVPSEGRPVDTERADAAEALQPVGARFGSFTLYPKLETSVAYSDNIYALPNKTGDGILRISPTLDLRGDFGTTTATLRGSLDRYQYFDNTSENRTDWSIGGNAQNEFSRDQFIYIAGGFSRAHEDRGDPNALTTDRAPTTYNLTEAGAGFSSDVTRFSWGGDFSYRYYNFEDNRQIGGGLVNNDDRDRDQIRVSGRVGLELSPGYRVLARGSYESVGYTANVDDAGFKRDNHGVRGTIGFQFELSRLLEGEIFGGYLQRYYKDPRFPDFGAVVYGSRLTWHPTALTTVRADVDRSVAETVAANYRGFLSTTYSLGVEHELLRSVILSASGRYGTDDYKRSTAVAVAQRNDDNYGATAGVRYALNRNVYTSANYEWSKRDSNINLPGTRFNRNKFTATLGLQF